MSFQINDEYGYQDYDYLPNVLLEVLKEEKVKDAIFSVVFVDNETIKSINREYRGKDAVTDVISFAFEDKKDDFFLEQRVLGDIFIAIPRMQEQAKEYGHSEKRELSFLAVHGLLHLLGYDHMTPEMEQIMFPLQEKILSKLQINK